MISAWEIYWVMQLDSINAVLSTFGVLSLIIAIIACLVYAIASAPPSDDDVAAAAKPIAFRMATASAVLWLAIAFVPTTKTAAVMIILPAVANSEVVQHEANELYGIAKDALRELAKPDAPAEAAEKADKEG